MTISKYAIQKIRIFTLHLDEIKAIKIFLAPLNEITTQKSHEFFFLPFSSLYKTKTKVDESREKKKQFTSLSMFTVKISIANLRN